MPYNSASSFAQTFCCRFKLLYLYASHLTSCLRDKKETTSVKTKNFFSWEY